MCWSTAAATSPSTEYSAENEQQAGQGLAATVLPLRPADVSTTRFAPATTARVTGGACANGDPALGRRRQWLSRFATGSGFINHYYPDVHLGQGLRVRVGDATLSRRSSDCNVRACAGGGIDSGVSCPLITSKAAGQTGVIIGGPMVVTNDRQGFYLVPGALERRPVRRRAGRAKIPRSGCSATPSAPMSLDRHGRHHQPNRSELGPIQTRSKPGFSIERAPAATGPWLALAPRRSPMSPIWPIGISTPAGSTWWYQVRAYNAAGNSAYTAL